MYICGVWDGHNASERCECFGMHVLYKNNEIY